MGGYTRVVSEQRLDKHVPVASKQILNNAKVGLHQWKACFLRTPCRDVISKGQGQVIVVSSVREPVKRRLGRCS
jgi:hypothetical protein